MRERAFLARSPLLPFILAATRLVLGPERYLAKWVLVFSGTATVALGYSLGRRSFGPRTGIAAAVVLALYPEFIVSSTLLLTEIPFITFNFAAFLFLLDYAEKPQPKTLILAGVFWALTILTRDQALYFTPVIALWLA